MRFGHEEAKDGTCTCDDTLKPLNFVEGVGEFLLGVTATIVSIFL